VTPCRSASAANTTQTIRRSGRIPRQRGSSRRTAAANSSMPPQHSCRGSPAQRCSRAASEARHVLDQNGLLAAVSTAGQTHSSRSRICYTSLKSVKRLLHITGVRQTSSTQQAMEAAPAAAHP
jgi:hypothetical protein